MSTLACTIGFRLSHVADLYPARSEWRHMWLSLPQPLSSYPPLEFSTVYLNSPIAGAGRPLSLLVPPKCSSLASPIAFVTL